MHRLLLVMAAFLFQSVTGVSQDYPKWFWEMPVHKGDLFAVGYSGIYRNIQDSFDEAFDDAKWRLFKDTECRIIGGTTTGRFGDSQVFLGKSYDILVDSSAFEEFERLVEKVDSLLTDDIVIVLVKKENDLQNEQINNSDLVGTGTSSIYYNLSSSWEEAEQNARIELALMMSSQLKSLSKQSSNSGQSVIDVKTDYLMRNVQTIRRKHIIQKGWVEVRVKILH